MVKLPLRSSICLESKFHKLTKHRRRDLLSPKARETRNSKIARDFTRPEAGSLLTRDIAALAPFGASTETTAVLFALELDFPSHAIYVSTLCHPCTVDGASSMCFKSSGAIDGVRGG